MEPLQGQAEIRPGEEAQLPALMALLPELAGAPSLELLGAWNADRLAGAAGIVWESGSRTPGFSFWLHVRPEHRRRGIGRAVVTDVLDRLAGETDGLWNALLIDMDSAEARFLAACGFEPQHRQFHFELDVKRFSEHALAVAQRLRQSGRIPAGARALPLRDSPLPEAERLILSQLQGDQQELRGALERAARGQTSAVDLDHSTAVIEDGAVVGVLLASEANQRWRAEATVVAPAWRNSYVPALLMASSAERAAGVAHVADYVCDEDNLYPVKMARRIGAALIATRAFYYRAVAAD